MYIRVVMHQELQVFVEYVFLQVAQLHVLDKVIQVLIRGDELLTPGFGRRH